MGLQEETSQPGFSKVLGWALINGNQKDTTYLQGSPVLSTHRLQGLNHALRGFPALVHGQDNAKAARHLRNANKLQHNTRKVTLKNNTAIGPYRNNEFRLNIRQTVLLKSMKKDLSWQLSDLICQACCGFVWGMGLI